MNALEIFFEKYNNTVAFSSVLISVATLWIGILINKRFGGNHLRSKQIDHVCEIINRLNKSTFEITFNSLTSTNGVSGYSIAVLLNIFEIGNYNILDENNNNSFNDDPVLFKKGNNQIFYLKDFIDSPLTPRRIANQLICFYNKSYSGCSFEAIKESTIERFVEIDKGVSERIFSVNEDEQSSYVQGDALAFKTWENFKEHSLKLKGEIFDWLKENGIDNPNFRDSDFKSTHK